MPASLVIDHLSKVYAGTKIPALDNLSLKVRPGEVYGYLGANGAGKSTTIRLLMNFLQPSSGKAQIMGLDSVRDAVAVKQHTGYLAGDVALYPKATGSQLLDYLMDLQKTHSWEYRRKLEKRFEADLRKPISSLSKGNRQKIGIIQALMHEPDVLILDEPTSGLDPLMQEAFYTSIDEARTRGAAVLMSSHNLVEAQRVCDRIGIIKHGKLIREQAMTSDMTFGKALLRVTFGKYADVTDAKKSAAIKVVSQADNNSLVLQPTGTIAAALKALSHYDIQDLQTEQLDLENEFLEFYGDKS